MFTSRLVELVFIKQRRRIIFVDTVRHVCLNKVLPKRESSGFNGTVSTSVDAET